jgi:hypothetical protein
MLGERRLGSTPFQTGELPCAGTAFTLIRPRYSPATATLSESAGSHAALFVKLTRPTAELTLTSTPPGAEFRVNREPVAQGRPVTVERYEKVRIQAKLPGHHRWQKTVYVTAANTPINATLAPRH